jgi:rod shape-determining protein MreC
VGVVINTSTHYALVMSLLNRDIKIPAQLRRVDGSNGIITWDGLDYREVILSNVSMNEPIAVGDTVETGNSSMFPSGVMVGQVASFEVKKGMFYEARVTLATDFKQLRYADVVRFSHYDELQLLENQAVTGGGWIE